ncbi:hypothetical protein [Baaleninema simplex]|nr:hypothetical protein [Baaleninema simplex]
MSADSVRATVRLAIARLEADSIRLFCYWENTEVDVVPWRSPR